MESRLSHLVWLDVDNLVVKVRQRYGAIPHNLGAKSLGIKMGDPEFASFAGTDIPTYVGHRSNEDSGEGWKLHREEAPAVPWRQWL